MLEPVATSAHFSSKEPPEGFGANPQISNQPDYKQQDSEQADFPRVIYNDPMSGESTADLSAGEEMEGVTVAVFLEDDDEVIASELLSDQPKVHLPTAHLVCKDTNERIAIDKPQFTVGRQSENVDYGIKNSTAISRVHAVILSRDGKYYLVDLNSSNKTYVNDRVLEPNIENEIVSGAEIRFADVAFAFVAA